MFRHRKLPVCKGQQENKLRQFIFESHSEGKNTFLNLDLD
jgi:hypothetical protein